MGNVTKTSFHHTSAGMEESCLWALQWKDRFGSKREQPANWGMRRGRGGDGHTDCKFCVEEGGGPREGGMGGWGGGGGKEGGT
jgi:hypothetical protein